MSHEQRKQKGTTRREFLKALAVVSGGTVLAACAPAATQAPAVEATKAPEAAATPAPAEQAKVVYWDVSSPEAVDGIAKGAVADRFREKNPDIDLELSYKPTTGDTQMSETLITAIAAGNPPDAAYFDRFVVPNWAAEGSLTDLTDLAAGAGIKEDDYYPFAWQEATGWKDKLWALPYDTDDRALYYNKDLVKKAGGDPENMPANIEEFDVLADAMFEKDGDRMITAGFIPWYSQGWLQTYGWSWDGHFWNKDTGEITANDPKIVASCEWIVDSYAKKYDITSFESFSSAFGSEAQRPFYTGQIAMQCTGNWELASLAKYAPDLDFGVVPMPYPKDGGRVATWAGGWSVVVPKGAPNVEGGFRFISYFAGPEEMDFFCRETKHIPTLKAAAANAFYTEDPNHKIFMDMLPIANTRPPVPIGQFLWTALAEARDLIIHGTKTPQEALDDVTTKSNEEMKRYQ